MSNNEETYMEHLKEIRKRFIRVFIFFIIILAAAFYFVPYIFKFIAETSRMVDLDFNVFNITDPLYLYLKVASIVAFIFTFPYLILELWLFISPALTKHEKKYVLRYIPLIIILFLGGIAFAYFVLVPYYVMFSQGLAGDASLNVVIGANKYIDFLTNLLLMFGLIFQLPVLVLVLSYIGILNSRFLIFIRKYAYFGLLIASAFITPPDPISMGIALVPLALLYETSVIICKLNERKRRKREAEE